VLTTRHLVSKQKSFDRVLSTDMSSLNFCEKEK